MQPPPFGLRSKSGHNRCSKITSGLPPNHSCTSMNNIPSEFFPGLQSFVRPQYPSLDVTYSINGAWLVLRRNDINCLSLNFRINNVYMICRRTPSHPVLVFFLSSYSQSLRVYRRVLLQSSQQFSCLRETCFDEINRPPRPM